MRILFTIAWRNIRQHKTKTTIIGLIMVIGIMILVVGNSLMDSATAGIEKYYIKNYTGHLMITGSTIGHLTLFGFQDMTGMEQAVPRIPQYEEVVEFARALPYVEAVSPQISTSALVSFNDEAIGATLLFGVNPGQYREMFPDNLEIISGGFWEPGEQGVLLSEFLVEQIKRIGRIEIRPGDRLLFTSMGMVSGMKIREVKVSGIFRFKQSNLQLDMVSLMDPGNVRALEGMVVGQSTPASLTEEERFFLGNISEEDLFGSSEALITDLASVDPLIDEEFWFPFLDSGGAGEQMEQEGTGAWQYLVIRLRDEKYVNQAEQDLARFFAAEDIDAQTGNWLQAAGGVALLSQGIKRIFNIVILIIAVVAIIVIMNTLVIAIIERMGEIGTMRAIGAQKRFVKRMVRLETLLLAGISGIIGLVLGALVLFVINKIGLKASNMFFEIIYGGKVLRPRLSLSSVLMSLVVIAAVGLISSSYPAAIVMRTSPREAMESSR